LSHVNERQKFDEYLQKRKERDWLSDPRQRDRLEILKKFLSNSAGFVLDCGSGEIEPVFVCNVPNAVALDIGASGLKNLKAKEFKGSLVLGSCTHLPFRNKCFEKAICSEVIEHLPTDLDVKKCIKELERVSRVFLVTTPNNQFDFRWLEQTHKRFFNRKSIRKFLPKNALVTTSSVSQSKAPYMPILPWFLLNKQQTTIGKYLASIDFQIRRSSLGGLIKKMKSPLLGMAFIVVVYCDRKVINPQTNISQAQ
jgi:SAM-dependent methyltransferase